MMRILAGAVGVTLLLIVLWDAFETIVLPRRVTRQFRLTRLFYRYTWLPWSALAGWATSEKRREAWLGFYGPLSLLFLLSVWAAGLIAGFGLLHWAFGSRIQIGNTHPGFGVILYFSGTTFFTLGLGDLTPQSAVARVLTVAEGGTGFGFLAIVIGYLPVIYQAFSRREVNISLLDARAGSPPSAAELLRRHSHDHQLESLQQLLHDWERWSAELLESHLSYPVLAYFRSQHNNQSWLSALTTMLDTCALVIAGVEGACQRQAELTFAMARHAVVDLAQVFNARPRPPQRDRLPPAELAHLRSTLAAAELKLHADEAADQALAKLRSMYEPYVNSLSEYLHVSLPAWRASSRRADNWQTSAWEQVSRIASADPADRMEDDHL